MLQLEGEYYENKDMFVNVNYTTIINTNRSPIFRYRVFLSKILDKHNKVFNKFLISGSLMKKYGYCNSS